MRIIKLSKISQKCIKFFILLLFLPISTIAKPITGPELDKVLLNLLEKQPVVGLAVAILEEGKLKYIRTYGYRNLTTKEPITKDTVFRLASVSKPISAGLATLLAYENKIDLEQDVTSISREINLPNNNLNMPVTLKNALSHSSGVDIWVNVLIENGDSREQQLSKLNLYKNNCLPGKCYRYNNTLFSLVKEASENISRNDSDRTYSNFSKAIYNRIFNPLEMNRTSIGTKEFLSQKNIALPYDRVDGSYDNFIEATVNENYDTVIPAAGFNSSVEDMAKWLSAQMGQRPDILPQDALKPLFEKIVSTPVELKRFNSEWRIKHLKDAHYGLGWRIYNFSGHEIIFHSGNLAGVSTAVAFSNETNSGIVVLTNTDSSLSSTIVSKFFEITFDI